MLLGRRNRCFVGDVDDDSDDDHTGGCDIVSVRYDKISVFGVVRRVNPVFPYRMIFVMSIRIIHKSKMIPTTKPI